MELQFQKKDIACMQPIKCQVQNLEQTQQLRLDDTFPAVEKVLCAWGQVLVREKQWNSTGAQVSGGVMVWVLYAPVEGPAQCVQTWVPFQMKMDLPQTDSDGSLIVNPLLRSVDARSVHDRKLVVRVDVGVQLCALMPHTLQVYTPEELPEDVQVRQSTYPVQLLGEAGEKAFVIDELLTPSSSTPPMDKLLYYRIQPELIDKKVMADKVVFRGCGLLHLMYLGTDGQMYSWDYELPFSQYAELSGQYEQDASARIVPAVTSLELTQEADGRLQLKAGLLGQYMVYARQQLQVAQDAYSTQRELTPSVEQLQLPGVLDMLTTTVHCELSVPFAGGRLADVTFCPDQPAQLRQDDEVELELSGQFTTLCCNGGGDPEGTVSGWTGQWKLPVDRDCQVQSVLCSTGVPAGIPGSGSVTLRADVLLDCAVTKQETLPMITGVTLEPRQVQPERPSLILRRLQGDDLWELAKQTGSTVEMIRQANGLTEDPDPDRMLLIPT